MSNIIALLFSIQLGWMPINSWYESNTGEWNGFSGSYFITIDTEAVILNHIFIGGWIDSAMTKHVSHPIFKPLQQTYQFRMGLRYKNVEIGYSHVCGPHPVMSYPTFGLNENIAPFEGGIDKIYIKVSNH